MSKKKWNHNNTWLVDKLKDRKEKEKRIKEAYEEFKKEDKK